jgi:transcriptional regulator with XRE-family HTH domain
VAEPKSADHVALGAVLRGRRTELKWTLEQLAYAVTPKPPKEPRRRARKKVPAWGMNPRYISAVERGEINVSWDNLLRLARALDVSMVEVATRYEEALRR